MRAAVRRFHSPDVDLEAFRPDDRADVGVLVQVIAGPANGPGEESFDVVVCTPKWLTDRLDDLTPLIGRHHLIVRSWDWPRIRLFLVGQVAANDAPTWPQLAAKIGRIGKWEFEDYSF